MVGKMNPLTRGDVYLARLDPAKKDEVGKMRPVVILTSQTILNVSPPIVFVCPLSNKSYPEFSALHVSILARDNLKVPSYALIEHCRSITVERILYPRLAHLTQIELVKIQHRVMRLIDA